MKFSIVMPVYNTEQYLEAAILSVINQTYKNWELIIVNDASPDNSKEIIDKYRKLEKRITLLNKSKNEGLILARLSGVELASGEYIFNLDSDDVFDKDTLLSVINFIKKYGEQDLITFNLSRVTKNGIELSRQEHLFDEGIISKADFYSIYFKDSSLNPICGKAIKTKVLNQVVLFENEKLVRGGEDRLLIAKSLLISKNFGYIDKVLYYYTYNETSISSSSYLNHVNDVCVTGEFIFENLISKVNDYRLKQRFFNDFSGRFFSVQRALFLLNKDISYESKKKMSLSLKKYPVVQTLLNSSYAKDLSFTGKLYLFFYKRENFFFLVKSWQIVLLAKKIKRGSKNETKK
ncbi:glycosyltransferase family 2 protein [Enterococcus sp. DIV0187]|uniref:glycosyltransferase family 2 protein n=1 Tax=Enterococcus sp. DIV0187 TaxID=2774644 RepID=UPI003F243E1D